MMMNIMTTMTRCLLSGLALALYAGFAGPAEAALCPTVSGVPQTVCVEFTEGAAIAGATLKDTVVSVLIDGVPSKTFTMPASSPAGGGTQNSVMSTVACQKGTYTATAFHNFMTSGVVTPGLVVSSVPVSGLTVDRTLESACLKVPTGFTLH